LSTSVIEPGTRLAGRYRLDDRVSEAGGSTFWKATDEILARPVAVLTFAPGFPRVREVITAARAASRLTDPRLTQVFDADDSGERAYIVSEWVTGDTLEDLLAQGPMDADRAASFLLEAAEALTSAHGAGLAHLCLTPHNLVWTSGGTVKITGLGVEAVLAGTASETPALDDTRGLGRMLYAALTGHWCGQDPSALPPAPSGSDGRPLAPGQVRAGVPHNVDAIVCRALQLRGEPLSAPSAFADALSQVPRSPLPFVPLVGSTPPAVVARPETTELPNVPEPTQTVPERVRSRGAATARHSVDRSDAVSKPMLAAIAAVVLVVVAVGGWGLFHIGGGDHEKKPGTSTTPIARKTTNTLEPARASAYNPDPHPDASAGPSAAKAIDGNDASAWVTQHYFNDHFGGFRKDIGLLLDMGHPVAVDRVRLTMPAATTPGLVELRIGDSGTPGMTKTATGDANGTFNLNGGHAKGRYVMLRFTKLPNIGQYKIKVNDVTVYGTG
jgi:eukaryotic-like serine/threonine-protein kinase